MLNFPDLCKKPMISRCKRCRHSVQVLAPGATPIFYPILSILCQEQPREMGKGKQMISSCAPRGRPVRCCVLHPAPAALRGSRTASAVRAKRWRGCPPTSPVACPLQNSPRAGGVTVPLDPVPCRCGGGVGGYQKMLVHPPGRGFSPRRGFTWLGFWSKWVG